MSFALEIIRLASLWLCSWLPVEFAAPEPALARAVAPFAALPATTPAATCVSYCTSSVSTIGCVPALSCTGTPSVSATSGFNLICTSVETQCNGKFMYSLNIGTLGLFFGSTSYRCIDFTQFQQMPFQNSGGLPGTCSGSLSDDWNAYMSTHPNALGNPLIVGQTFYVQARYTAPAYGNKNLSDGLMFVVGP